MKYGKVKFHDGIYIGGFDENNSNMRVGTFRYKDRRVASGIIEDGVLSTGTISFSDGRVFYAEDRFDEDSTYDGSMFETNGTWSQRVYDSGMMKLIDGWKFDAHGECEEVG